MMASSLASKMSSSWALMMAMRDSDDGTKLDQDNCIKLGINDGSKLDQDNGIKLDIQDAMELGLEHSM
eukprot:12426479-Ditylum_brightwellii.AAC.1